MQAQKLASKQAMDAAVLKRDGQWREWGADMNLKLETMISEHETMRIEHETMGNEVNSSNAKVKATATQASAASSAALIEKFKLLEKVTDLRAQLGESEALLRAVREREAASSSLAAREIRARAPWGKGSLRSPSLSLRFRPLSDATASGPSTTAAKPPTLAVAPAAKTPTTAVATTGATTPAAEPEPEEAAEPEAAEAASVLGKPGPCSSAARMRSSSSAPPSAAATAAAKQPTPFGSGFQRLFGTSAQAQGRASPQVITPVITPAQGPASPQVITPAAQGPASARVITPAQGPASARVITPAQVIVPQAPPTGPLAAASGTGSARVTEVNGLKLLLSDTNSTGYTRVRRSSAKAETFRASSEADANLGSFPTLLEAAVAVAQEDAVARRVGFSTGGSVVLQATRLLQRVTSSPTLHGAMQQVQTEEKLIVRALPCDGEPRVRVEVAVGLAAHKKGGRTGQYWVEPSYLSVDGWAAANSRKAAFQDAAGAEDAMASLQVNSGPERLPAEHSLTPEDAAGAAAAVERGYWASYELPLREKVLEARKVAGVLSDLEGLILTSFSIDPAEALRVRQAQLSDGLDAAKLIAESAQMEMNQRVKQIGTLSKAMAFVDKDGTVSQRFLSSRLGAQALNDGTLLISKDSVPLKGGPAKPGLAFSDQEVMNSIRTGAALKLTGLYPRWEQLQIGGEVWILPAPAGKLVLSNNASPLQVSTAGRFAAGTGGRYTFGTPPTGCSSYLRWTYANTTAARANLTFFQPIANFAECDCDHINGDIQDDRLCNHQFLTKSVHTNKTAEDARLKTQL